MLIASLSLGLGVVPAYPQEEPISKAEFHALKEDLDSIKTELVGVKKELKLLRALLAQRSAQLVRSPDAMVNVGIVGNPLLGNKESPLTLIEFSDYQCPYCARSTQTTLPALKAEYIDTGKLRYVFRDFPIDQLHPHARKAAEAAHCAGDQGKYWEMHDVLFQNHKALHVEQLKGYAHRLGLDATTFDACLEQGRYAAEVQKDLEDGTAAGVQGTPGFFLGKTRSDDTIQGVFIRGAQPIAAFQQAIERLLGGK
jgi:protein-disulfide isomerase